MILTRYKRLNYRIHDTWQFSRYIPLGGTLGAEGLHGWFISVYEVSGVVGLFTPCKPLQRAACYFRCACVTSLRQEEVFSSLTKRKERSRVVGTVTGWFIPKMNVASQRHNSQPLRHNSQLWTCKQWTRPPSNLIKTSVLVYMWIRVLERSNRSNNSTLTQQPTRGPKINNRKIKIHV